MLTNLLNKFVKVPVKDCQTEKLILDTAMKIFFAEGRMHATTQEIADAAGVNRTLINYYFGSKKELFNKLVKRVKKDFPGDSDRIFMSDLPFREKTARFVENFLDRLLTYPYLESYLMLNSLRDLNIPRSSKIPQGIQNEATLRYLKEIEQEMKEGRIPEGNPAHFLINLFSLIIYPFLARPLQMRLLDMDEKDYQQILQDRKNIILKTVLPEDKYLSNENNQ